MTRASGYMPPREPRAYLNDALAAIDAIDDFVRAKSYEDYIVDRLLQSAVERQFVIVGEALAQWSRLETSDGALIPDLPRIVGFCNVLVHGYALVDHDQVWAAVVRRLPTLRAVLNQLLNDG